MKIITQVIFMFALVFVSIHTAEAVQPIDQFTVMDQASWNCAKTIAVTMFPVVGEFKGEKNLDYYQNDFASKLASSLRKIPGVEKVDVVDGKTTVLADILIDGKFKDLTTGSRALRFWVGFGAGKSFCRADMKGIDLKSGSEVFSLDHARGSAMDIVSEDELLENIDEVVEDVAAGLIAARRVCASGSSPAK
ncbi:MAG: hypothetical protein FD174_1565 [Geobacteraceae bacterium]|nr:MAG: hypothetical protein FD174_1565 [Geobacteraceae bacterium]